MGTVSKVAVVGAGAVGTAIAYAAQIRGVCRQLALFDLNADKVRAEVLDLNHGMLFTPMAQITKTSNVMMANPHSGYWGSQAKLNKALPRATTTPTVRAHTLP